MTDDNGCTAADKAFGNLFCFSVITGIIPDIKQQLLTGDTALGVDRVNGSLSTMHHLLTKNCILTRHGACNADGDISAGRGRE